MKMKWTVKYSKTRNWNELLNEVNKMKWTFKQSEIWKWNELLNEVKYENRVKCSRKQWRELVWDTLLLLPHPPIPDSWVTPLAFSNKGGNRRGFMCMSQKLGCLKMANRWTNRPLHWSKCQLEQLPTHAYTHYTRIHTCTTDWIYSAQSLPVVSMHADVWPLAPRSSSGSTLVVGP